MKWRHHSWGKKGQECSVKRPRFKCKSYHWTFLQLSLPISKRKSYYNSIGLYNLVKRGAYILRQPMFDVSLQAGGQVRVQLGQSLGKDGLNLGGQAITWWREMMMSPAAPGRRLLYAEKKAVSWTSLPFVFVLERQLLENILVVFLPLLLFTYFYFFPCWLGIFWKGRIGGSYLKLQSYLPWN